MARISAPEPTLSLSAEGPRQERAHAPNLFDVSEPLLPRTQSIPVQLAPLPSRRSLREAAKAGSATDVARQQDATPEQDAASDQSGELRRVRIRGNQAERKLEARAEAARVLANTAPITRPTVIAAKPVLPPAAGETADRPRNRPVAGARRRAQAKPGRSTGTSVRRAGTGRSIRSLASKGFTLLAMAFVAGMTISSSIPASALLTQADVAAQASLLQASAPGHAEAPQTYTASGGDTLTVARDGYETSTVEQIAEASGIRMEPTFTNNPNGTIQWPFPVGVHIGDRFGYRDCAGCTTNHHGQDFNPGYGAPVQAIADGVVSVAADNEGELGVHMIIDHQINGQLVSSVYAHLEHDSLKFNVGDKVKVGQIIGLTGTTGYSTGPHLHFEIRLNGTDYVDPLEWLYANTN